MNGKAGDTQYRLVNLDELRLKVPALVRDDDSARQGQVAVEPGMPYAATIQLDAYLEVAGLGALRDGPHLVEVGQCNRGEHKA